MLLVFYLHLVSLSFISFFLYTTFPTKRSNIIYYLFLILFIFVFVSSIGEERFTYRPGNTTPHSFIRYFQFTVGFPVPSPVFSFSFNVNSPLYLSSVIAFFMANWLKKKKTHHSSFIRTSSFLPNVCVIQTSFSFNHLFSFILLSSFIPPILFTLKIISFAL